MDVRWRPPPVMAIVLTSLLSQSRVCRHPTGTPRPSLVIKAGWLDAD